MAGLVKTLASSRYGTTSSQGGSLRRPSLANALAPVSDVLNSAQQASKLGYQRDPSIQQAISNRPPINGVTNVDASSPYFNGPKQAGGDASAPRAPATNANGVDYSSDPVLQRIHALNETGRQDAASSALAGRKQALIGHGYDPSIDQSGADRALFPDEQTLQAAQSNPFSTLSQLKHNEDVAVSGLEDKLNKANLYYSSERGNQLGEAGRDYQLALSQASSNRDSQLGSLASALLGARQQADQSDIGAESDAYSRATTLSQLLGGAYAGGGGGGVDTSAAGGTVGPTGGSRLDTGPLVTNVDASSPYYNGPAITPRVRALRANPV